MLFCLFVSQTERQCREGLGTLCPSWWLGGGFLCKPTFCLAAEQSPADGVILLINTHQLEVCPRGCFCACLLCVCAGELENRRRDAQK